MKLKTSLAPLLFAALFAAAAAQGTAPLKVGDKAPAMKVAKWVKGSPVKSFDKGKVYVVEFWATWCGPCKQSIPHLTELAKKYAGKVNFTGVSVWEVQPGTADAGYMDKVKDFVKEMGSKMAYNVAVDGLDASMAKTWMEAAGQDGIPTAFVINQEGKVAWIGHPMGELDSVLNKVVTGKFDAKGEAAAAAKKEAETKAAMELTQGLREALGANDLPRAISEIDKIVAAKPEMETQLAQTKFMILLRIDEPKAYDYAKKLAAGIYKNDAESLNMLAWTIVDDKSQLKNPDIKASIEIGTKACELTKFENAMILDTLAYAYFKDGKIDKAIELQEKAVKFINKDEMPADMQKEIKDRLDTFKKKKAGGAPEVNGC